jgi:SNF2 family DNA or RNA helicase
MATLTYDRPHSRFVAKVTFHERHIAKGAGFQWDPQGKLWFTVSPANAARLSNLADESAKLELERIRSATIIKPWTGLVPVPPGLTPYPFQIEKAVPWAMSRPKTYLALDPGLGKTICAALIMNCEPEVPVVYTCPPFLVDNVREELIKWTWPARPVAVFNTKKPGSRLSFSNGSGGFVVIVPDTLFEKAQADIASMALLGARLITDEAHRFKTITAKRTRFLFDNIAPLFKKQTYLSGTPMPNRTLELYPVLEAAAPKTYGHRSMFDFGVRYCAGYHDGYGWDFSGDSNTEELMSAVHREFMLRIRKEDALPELPAKHETISWIGEQNSALKKLERAVLDEHKPEDLMSVTGSLHLSTYLKLLGTEKAPHAVEHAREMLEAGRSVLIFAVHKEAIALITDGLKTFKPLVIDGSVGNEERFRRAKLFQESKEHPVMVLNIQAGGVGFNLTKATEVLFAECRWVPAELEQAADRAHRIGQKDFVNVKYLCFKDSLDSIMLSSVLRKRSLIKNV